MNLMDLLMLVVIAGVCGYIGGQLMGAKRMNLVVMVILGFVGATAGKLLASFFHLPLLWELKIAGNSFPIVWAVIGSIVVVGLFTFIQQH